MLLSKVSLDCEESVMIFEKMSNQKIVHFQEQFWLDKVVCHTGRHIPIEPYSD